MDTQPLLTFTQFLEYLTANKSVPKYDSSLEEKTPHPFWNLDRNCIDGLLKSISVLVTDRMEHVPPIDKELVHLRKTAQRVAQIDRGPTLKVALIGSQGAGKSLLINALFDQDGLSLTGAEGGACTTSIVRYAQYTGNVTSSGDSKFVADVKFLDVSKIETLINEHARSYYYYQHDVEVSDDEEGPGTKTLQEDQHDRRLNDTAEDVFATLFGSREQFLESWRPADFRNGEFSQLCQTKSEDAIQSLGINSQRVKTFIGNNAEELLEKIKPFLSKVKDEACLWPLVDSIFIRLDHDLLKQGVEIIDLPGVYCKLACFDQTDCLQAPETST